MNRLHRGTFDYSYPDELIAQEPAKPRDAARLLVYDRKTHATAWDTFLHLPNHLPPRSVVVLNETRVIPARLWARKPTGGRVQVFYVRHDRKWIYALSQSPLPNGLELEIAPRVKVAVVGREQGSYILKPSFPTSQIMQVLEKYGTTPIPPYIKHASLSERRLRAEYQSVFAKVRGSIAAPTASLHFTKRLIARLVAAGHDVQYVTLHVGLGTFAPVTSAQIASGRLHAEQFEITPFVARTLMRAKNAGRSIVAVGTTVARTLESASDANGHLKRLHGETDLFIREGYRWRFVDSLITNFHVPKSSLLMLVSAFAGKRQIMDLYQRAITERFRLFSFGDGMLIR